MGLGCHASSQHVLVTQESTNAQEQQEDAWVPDLSVSPGRWRSQSVCCDYLEIIPLTADYHPVG